MFRISRLRRAKEVAIHAFLISCALLSVLTTVGITYFLISESVPFFQTVSPFDFLFGLVWSPMIAPPSFGAIPLIGGTFLVAAGALIVAVPIGVCTALFMSEYAPPVIRQIVKPVLEILAGIPSVVYGFFALYFITPNLLRPLLPNVDLYNAASAAIVVGIMVIPTIASLCDDAFRAVPRALREAAYALSATKFEVSTKVVLPAALSGVFAAVLLALGRAVGETMAVTLAAGKLANLTLDPRQSVLTMTAHIADVTSGDTPAGSIGYQTAFAVGLLLFVITLAINIVAQFVLKRFREAYE